jgi:hypothetical protein
MSHSQIALRDISMITFSRFSQLVTCSIATRLVVFLFHSWIALIVIILSGVVLVYGTGTLERWQYRYITEIPPSQSNNFTNDAFDKKEGVKMRVPSPVWHMPLIHLDS